MLEVELLFKTLNTIQEVELHILFASLTGLVLTSSLYMILKMCRRPMYTAINP
jgi:hypothetical protein